MSDWERSQERERERIRRDELRESMKRERGIVENDSEEDGGIIDLPREREILDTQPEERSGLYDLDEERRLIGEKDEKKWLAEGERQHLEESGE